MLACRWHRTRNIAPTSPRVDDSALPKSVESDNLRFGYHPADVG